MLPIESLDWEFVKGQADGLGQRLAAADGSRRSCRSRPICSQSHLMASREVWIQDHKVIFKVRLS